MKQRSGKSGLCYALAAFLMILFVLFWGDDVGLSNNGDFIRVMNGCSLTWREGNQGFVYQSEFRIVLTEEGLWANAWRILTSPDGWKTYPSVQLLVTRVSVVLNLFLNVLSGQPIERYRMGVLAVMQGAAYAGVIGFVFAQFRLKKPWQDILFKCLCLVVLCDIGYVAWFASFYGEALQHIALLFCLGMTLRVWRRSGGAMAALVCALAALLYGWSKFFNLPAALVILVLDMLLIARKNRWKTAAATGVVTAAVMAVIYLSLPGWMDLSTNYNAVFYGALHEVTEEEAESYLEDLGLPVELTEYRDTNYYVLGLEQELREQGLHEAIEGIQKGDLLRFYLRYPGRLWELLKISARHSGMIRPYYLANYGPEHNRMTLSDKFSLWSKVRAQLPFDSLWGSAVLALLFFAALWLWASKRGGRKALLLSLCLSAILAYSFALPVMTNGLGDLGKHQFAFAELMDLLFLASLGLALTIRERKPGRGSLLLSLWLLFLLCLPVGEATATIIRDSQRHDGLESGAYVSFGTVDGEAVLWQVMASEGELVTLMAAEDLACRPYDLNNGNDWKASSVRGWLNGDFLQGFSPDEQARLRYQNRWVLCSLGEFPAAETGKREFLCNPIAVDCAMNSEDAWRYECADLVRLPDVTMVERLAKEGRLPRGDYWLETPYALNNVMARYVSDDGYVMLSDTDTIRGLRPVIVLEHEEPIEGHGSRGRPFILF